jgi:hypothetical protein
MNLIFQYITGTRQTEFCLVSGRKIIFNVLKCDAGEGCRSTGPIL